MTYVDWKRLRCFVEPTDLPGRARWSSAGGGLSFEITRGFRDVLLGHDPPGVTLSRRTANALGELGELREHHRSQVSDGRTVLEHSAAGHLHWWTWAGTAANRTLHTSLPALVDPRQCLGDRVIPMRADLDTRELSAALDETDPADLGHPPVTDAAVSGLKFSAALPPGLAQATIAARLADQSGAASALADDRIILHSG